MAMQIRRTLAANSPPANGSLAEGQLSAELATLPPRLWVGGAGGLTNIQLNEIPPLPLSVANGGTGAANVSATSSGIGQLLTNSGGGSGPVSAMRQTSMEPNGLNIIVATDATGVGSNPFLRTIRSRGTLAGNRDPVQSGDRLGSVVFRGFHTTAGSAVSDIQPYSSDNATFEVQASQNWTATAHGTRIVFATTANGSIAERPVMELTDGGTMQMGSPGGAAVSGLGSVNVSTGYYINGVRVGFPDPATAGNYLRTDTGTWVAGLPLSGGTMDAAAGIAWAGAMSLTANGIRYPHPTLGVTNSIGFSWSGTALLANVDMSGAPGALATAAQLAGYLPLGGGSLSGALSITTGGVTAVGNLVGNNGQLNGQGVRYTGLVSPPGPVGNAIGFTWTGALGARIDGGDVGNVTLTPSDARLKRNVGDVTCDALAAIGNIELHKFDLDLGVANTPARHHEIGFIAQQLREVIPEAVFDGDDTRIASLDLMPLMAYAFRAVQQLADEVNRLKGRRNGRSR
jgi:hypothetical protein